MNNFIDDEGDVMHYDGNNDIDYDDDDGAEYYENEEKQNEEDLDIETADVEDFSNKNNNDLIAVAGGKENLIDDPINANIEIGLGGVTGGTGQNVKVQHLSLPKNKSGIVHKITGSDRRSSNKMTSFERASVISARAREIEDNAENVHPLIEKRVMENGITSALVIAEMELEEISIPFPIIILRTMNQNTVEVWPVRDLVLPSQILSSAYSFESTSLLF